MAQARIVSGRTIRASQRARGMRIARALRMVRSEIRSRGFLTERRKHAQFVAEQQELRVTLGLWLPVRTRLIRNLRQS